MPDRMPVGRATGGCSKTCGAGARQNAVSHASLLKRGDDLLLDDAGGYAVLAGGVACAKGDAHFAVVNRHQQQQPVIAVFVANAPTVEQSLREGRNVGRGQVVVARPDGDHGHLAAPFFAGFQQQGVDLRLGFFA